MNYYANTFMLEDMVYWRRLRMFGIRFLIYERRFHTRSISTPLRIHIRNVLIAPLYWS